MKDLPYLNWVFSTNSTLLDFTESVSKQQRQLFSNNLNKRKHTQVNQFYTRER